MEPDILIGTGLGALAGLAIARIFSQWPSGRVFSNGTINCTACDRVIRQVWSLPLLWFLPLRGRCPGCGANVDPLIPAIELLAIAIGAIAALWFSDPLSAIAAALLGWQLLLLASLDLAHRWLPDPLNLLLAASGLGFAAAVRPDALPELLLGLVAGYASLELVRHGYRRLRGREGVGGGDPKLFAAIGCWLGWEWLPKVMVLAALGGLLTVAGLVLAGRRPDAATRIPLGTLLALSAWPVWMLSHAS